MIRKCWLLSACLLLLVPFMLTGCVTTSTLFTNADQVLVGQALPNYELRVKPGDELRVIVSSTVPEATAMYNVAPYSQSAPNESKIRQETNLVTYRVTPSGTITMPVLGDIAVAGKTSEEVKQTILDMVSSSVKDPVVSVELVGFEVSVIGEVVNPQRILVTMQRFSVLDALAACNGLKLTGVKERVRLVREVNGQVETHVLDLCDANLVNSPYYYMQQNDLLLVDAERVAKTNALYNQQNGYRLSVVSTSISAISVIASLIIALSR